MTKYFKQITLLLVIATVAVNGLAEALPFNNISTAAISDKFSTLFTPAGYVFAIWGIIYIGWIAYAVFPFLNKKHDGQLLKAFPSFIIAAIANMLWLVLWHYEQLGLSVIVMLILLGSLIIVYRKLEIGITKVPKQVMWMVNIPVSIYLGWISVATIANISAFLTQIQWDRFGQPAYIWAILMIIVAAALGGLMIFLRKDMAFAGVLIWAFWGISIALAGTQETENLVILLAITFLVSSLVYKFVLFKEE